MKKAVDSMNGGGPGGGGGGGAGAMGMGGEDAECPYPPRLMEMLRAKNQIGKWAEHSCASMRMSDVRRVPAHDYYCIII